MPVSQERMEELMLSWDQADLMDDDEYFDWYSDLTEDEQALIDRWDAQFEKGVLALSSAILDLKCKGR